MRTVKLQEAEARLSQLIEQAAAGEPFIIAKDGKPMVRVLPLEPAAPVNTVRIGFLAGRFRIPDDFDNMGQDQIERMFLDGGA